MRDNFTDIDWQQVCEVSCLKETAGWVCLLWAREYLVYQSWCGKILEEFFACKICDDFYVFLFEVESPKEDADRFVWVVCGNVPSLYLTTDFCPTPKDVAETYCDLVEQWCDGTLPDLDFSVKDVPDTMVQEELRRRIAALKLAIEKYSFPSYERAVELSDNPHRRLEREYGVCSYIILRNEHLVEDLHYAAVHDARAMCTQLPMTSLSHVFELADKMNVKSLDVADCTDTVFAANGSVENLRWTTEHPLPESLDFSNFPNLRYLSINALTSGAVRIVAQQLEEVTVASWCKRGILQVDLSTIGHLNSVTNLTCKAECLLPKGVRQLCLRSLSAKAAEKLEFNDMLYELDIEDGTITDLAFLSRLPSLRKLHLYGLSKLTNLDGLRGLPLEELRIDTCNSVNDFTLLCSLPLVRLFIRRHGSKPLADIRFIADIPTLEMCNLDAKVTDKDLTPLEKLKCCDYKGILTDERRAQNRRYLVANGYINTWYDRRNT
ncbi:MAG: leucine-rich repeat domain-containing protein [Victivallales bacterium]|nr:leucine-rich repeat domain-containing protein [Victivallales bacterium]